MAILSDQIDQLWAGRDDLVVGDADATAVVAEAIALLDSGEARVAEMVDGDVGRSPVAQARHLVVLPAVVDGHHRAGSV